MTFSKRHIALALLGFATLISAPLVAVGQTDPPTDPQEPPPESTAAPYQFKNEGIFGCNQVAGANASAGTLAAIGGVYVPVNDAAVTLNTGILVYKECVLRPLQDRLRESASSALLKRATIGIETGREGNKRYVVQIRPELRTVDDRATLSYLTGPALETVHPALRDSVRRALAVNFRAETRGSDEPDCAYGDDLVEATTRPTQHDFEYEKFEELGDPDCNPYFAFSGQKEKLDAARSTAISDQITVWDWGRGFYALTDNAQDPFEEKILTPSSVVQESFQTILDSPVRQLENVKDVGEMISALFAGITTHIISDSRGLAGVTQSIGGQPSYLEQVAKESSQGVIGAAVNAALTILNASREIESRYLAAMEAIAANLTQTINQIRSTERACWNLVVPRSREYAASNGLALDEVKINTSTSSLAFSQQIIDSQITPLANAALTNVQNSRRAFGLIDQLIASVTNTASLNAQRLALQQLDTLVAERALHSRFDAENAAKQKEDVQGAMATLVQDTAKAWGDSPDPSIGWCNINNIDIPRLWAERWKK